MSVVRLNDRLQVMSRENHNVAIVSASQQHVLVVQHTVKSRRKRGLLVQERGAGINGELEQLGADAQRDFFQRPEAQMLDTVCDELGERMIGEFNTKNLVLAARVLHGRHLDLCLPAPHGERVIRIASDSHQTRAASREGNCRDVSLVIRDLRQHLESIRIPDADKRTALLAIALRSGLSRGDITTVRVHRETGDLISVTAKEALTIGGFVEDDTKTRDIVDALKKLNVKK